MINRNYIANLFRRHRVLLAVSFLFVGLFQVLIMTVVDTFDVPGMLQGMVQRMPLPVQQLFGEALIDQFSIGGGVGFGYNHPFVLVTLSLVAITLPAAHIAGEIENGTLELLFTMPVRRLTIASSLWLGSGVALFGLTLGCWLGTGVGILIFPEMRSLDVSSVLRLGTNLFLLMGAVSSYTLLLSAFAREGGKTALRAAGLTLLFYFIDVVVGIWPAVDFMAPFTLFHYYQPQDLMRGAPVWGRSVAVLALIIAAAGSVAIAQIHRRNIP